MFAPLLAIALTAEPPKIVKPVSLHAVTANSIVVDAEFDRPCVPEVTIRQDLPNSDFAIQSFAGPSARTHWTWTVKVPWNTGTKFKILADEASAAGSVPPLPVAGAKTPFTFVVVGDARDHAKWAELARAIAEKNPRFVLDTGDNVERDKPDDWRDYYVAGQSLFANVPFFAVRGNHDQGTTFAEYNPAPPTGIGPSTYAFTYGNAGFLAIDSNDFANPKQLEFASKALLEMSGGPLFVFQHHPLYSCGIHGDSQKMQMAFQALFEKAHVTVDFAGHDHDLIEWKPINGVHYVVSGGGGTVTYPVVHCGDQPFAKQSFGFVLVTVDGAKVSMKFFDEHGIELHTSAPMQASGPSVPAIDLTKLAH